MQQLYAFFKSENKDIKKGEEELFNSFDVVYKLYIHVLAIFNELVSFEENRIQEAKQKRLPSEEDLNPNLRFINNRLLKQLSESDNFLNYISKYKIDYSDNPELIKKIVLEIKSQNFYNDYMIKNNDDYSNDRDFLINIFSSVILNNQLFIEYTDEKNIFFTDDYELVGNMIVKTFKFFKENSNITLLKLYKDKEDDSNFAKNLYRKTIENSGDYQSIIGKKTEKWDTDRIAFMDMLLMKMAICEFKEFPTIPVRATMDEYIDISKSYSTPKSSVFINGILDNIHQELKFKNEISKKGRGLVEK